MYTQLVLNQCQLTRPNWPEAPVLAFCCSGFKEIWWRSGKEAVWLRSQWPSSFGLSTFSFPLTPLADLHSEWMNTVHFYRRPRPPPAPEPTWERFTSMQTGATYTYTGFRFCQALKVALQSFHFPKNEWRLGCVSIALEIQLFLSIWSVKLGRWNIQITDCTASGNHGIKQTVGAGCFTACGQRRH